MAARAYWIGSLRLSLVTIPVEMFNAVETKNEISFRQIHKPSGRRINYTKTVQGIGEVKSADIVKGYEVDQDTYVTLEPEEIEAVKLESKKTLELTQFVDASDIDAIYYDKPYYVVPADDLAEEAFVVLREALRKAKKVGLGQLALRGREYVVSLKPCGRGMVLETLRYADEVNKAASYFREIGDAKPDEDLLDLAATLIDKKTGPFHPDEYHDRYVDALKDLIARKRKGKTIEAEEEEPAPSRGSNVVDLMAALKRSLEKPNAANDESVKTKPAKAAARTSAPKKAAAKDAAPAKKTPARKRA